MIVRIASILEMFFYLFLKKYYVLEVYSSPPRIENQCQEIGFSVNWKRLTKGSYLLSTDTESLDNMPLTE